MSAKVIAAITTSVDGYVVGPDDRPGQGLGVGAAGLDAALSRARELAGGGHGDARALPGPQGRAPAAWAAPDRSRHHWAPRSASHPSASANTTAMRAPSSGCSSSQAPARAPMPTL